MKKYTVHGAYDDPKRARQYARFSSRLDYATREEAEVVLEEWKVTRDFPYLWIEEVGK